MTHTNLQSSELKLCKQKYPLFYSYLSLIPSRNQENNFCHKVKKNRDLQAHRIYSLYNVKDYMSLLYNTKG